MSTTPLDLPVLIAQMPYAQKLANAEVVKSDVAKSIFAPVLQQSLKDKEAKVQEVNKKEKTTGIDRDGHNQQEAAAPGGDRKKKKKKTEDEEPMASNASPWTGNLIDVKI